MAGEARSARRGRGIAYAVVSAMLFGCIPSLTQGLYAAGTTGYQIALVRMGLSALLTLGCALSYSVYTVAVARPVLADVAPTVVFFYGCLATVALSAPFTVGSDFSVWLAPAPVVLVVVLAMLANTVPYLLYIEATRLAGSQDASLLSYIELAVIVVVSAVATGVVPGAFELVGCALIAAAGLAIALGSRKGA